MNDHYIECHQCHKEYDGMKFNRCPQCKVSDEAADAIKNLCLDKQSITDMLFYVQGGYISCRRAASEILKLVK